MCFTKILRWLGIIKEPQPPPPPPPSGPSTTSSTPQVLPHPEEPFAPNATVQSVSVPDIITQWLTERQVPPEHWDYWRSQIDVQIVDVFPDWVLAKPDFDPDTLAFAYEQDGIRHIFSKPGWFNPGVVAHEQAHNSYALLDESECRDFANAYHVIKDTDPWIQLLYSINDYGLKNDIEGHAEVYRYICRQMPASLKPFYPKLF